MKCYLNAHDVTDIATRYEAGETTQQVGNRYGISKSRVTTILREQGITIRRQGLNDEHISEAATLYAAGRSLAWLGARYGISIRPSLLRFDAKACNCGHAQDGVKPRCSVDTRKVLTASTNTPSSAPLPEELELGRERRAAARQASRACGQHIGRPKALDEKKAALAQRMNASGESASTIAGALGGSRATAYRVLADGIAQQR